MNVPSDVTVPALAPQITAESGVLEMLALNCSTPPEDTVAEPGDILGAREFVALSLEFEDPEADDPEFMEQAKVAAMSAKTRPNSTHRVEAEVDTENNREAFVASCGGNVKADIAPSGVLEICGNWTFSPRLDFREMGEGAVDIERAMNY